MKKLLGDTFLLSAAELLNRCKGVLFIPIIVRAVGFEGYGAFVTIFIMAKLCASLCRLEVGQGFQRFASGISPDERRLLGRHFWSVFLPAMGLATVGGVLLAGLAPWLSRVFLDGRHETSLEVACLVVLSNTCFSVVRNFMLSRKQFARQSLLTLGYGLLPYVAFVLAATLSESVLPGIAAYALVDGLVALVALGHVARRVAWAAPSPGLFRGYVGYSAPLALASIQGGLLDKADRFFISGFLGLHAVGTYNVIYRLTELVGFVAIPLRTQLLTYLSIAWDRGRVRESMAILRSSLLAFLMVSLGMLACLAFYFEDVYRIVAGTAETVPHARWIVVLIGVGILAHALERFYYLFIRLRRRTVDEFRYQFLGLAVNGVGNYLLIPELGLLGAALATLASYLVMIPLIGRRYSMELDLPFWLHVASFAGLALVIWPLQRLLPAHNLPWLVSSVLAAYATYVGILIFFKRRFLSGLRRRLGELLELTH